MNFSRIFLFTVIILNSCSKPVPPKDEGPPEISSRADYDTTAVDSFSAGATQNVLKPAVDSVFIAKKDSAKTTKKSAASAKKDTKDKPKDKKTDAGKPAERKPETEEKKPGNP